MIEFVIIENNNKYIKKYEEIITQEMLKNDYEYKITINSISQKDSFKVYIVSYSDDQAIQDIRSIDWSSMLIITVEKDINICNIVNKRWMPIDIIVKSYDFDKYFKRAINISIKNYISRPNTIMYSYKNTIYNIPLEEVLWIYKEKEERRCLIKTEEANYYIGENISKIETKLNTDFIKCNRSMIINCKKVRSYSIKNNIITFDGGFEVNDISRNCRKDIINHLRGIE